MPTVGQARPLFAITAGVATTFPAAAFGQNTDDGSGYGIMAFLLIFAAIIYEIPAIIAFMRGHPNRWVILGLCTVFGATGIVWVGCLIWAFSAVHRTRDPHGTHGGESGLNVFANDIQRMRIENLPPPMHPRQDHHGDMIDRLERLKKLHDNGVIDDAQFNRMRDGLITGGAG